MALCLRKNTRLRSSPLSILSDIRRDNSIYVRVGASYEFGGYDDTYVHTYHHEEQRRLQMVRADRLTHTLTRTLLTACLYNPSIGLFDKDKTHYRSRFVKFRIWPVRIHELFPPTQRLTGYFTFFSARNDTRQYCASVSATLQTSVPKSHHHMGLGIRGKFRTCRFRRWLLYIGCFIFLVFFSNISLYDRCPEW